MTNTITCSLRNAVAGVLVLGAVATLVPAEASAQFFSSCNTASVAELERSMAAHNEHVFRLESKFRDIWYRQGFVGPEVSKRITLERVRAFVAALPDRKAAILFHAAQGERLCTWLITPRGPIVRNLQRVEPAGWEVLQHWPSIAARHVRNARVATVADAHGPPVADGSSVEEARRVLARIGAFLLPPRIATALLNASVDTLIVVPVTMRGFRPETDVPDEHRNDLFPRQRDRSEAVRLTLAVATTPLAALPLGDKMLIDYMSVTVAPGFFVFAQDPAAVAPPLSSPLVAGNPQRNGFAALPGAEREAEAVARVLGTSPLVGMHATKAAVESRLRRDARAVDYVHLATHGLSDPANPLDGSFLVFSDGNWTAREIGLLRRPVEGQRDAAGRPADLPLLSMRPLVVMSACQTGLGKDFDVGTTGLARAWLRAGASNVVMSLWNVDDEATRVLMTDFVDRLVAGKPPDRALREAAIATRAQYPSPVQWAAFGVFGAPLRERASAGTH